MKHNSFTLSAAENLSRKEFAKFGDGSLAYIKSIPSEEIQNIYPEVPDIEAGIDLYALIGADGVPLMITDNKNTALENASEQKLAMMSLH